MQEKEFYNLIAKYINHPKVQEMKYYRHHGSNRLDHSFRVAYYTYKITKKLRLDYMTATKAAMLHDFFLGEVENLNGLMRLSLHPGFAAKNAKKYFSISKREEDIIRTHMFPITFIPPKYLEGWIVDLVDDFVSIKERGYITINYWASLFNLGILILFISMR